MISLNDGYYQIDKAVFNKDKGEEKIVYSQYSFSEMTAFSINWPYVTFAGLNNNLDIINAFQRKMIHRIEIAPPHAQESGNSTKAYIEQTFITDTKDLFILIYDKNHYLVYTIDLDKTNALEN